MEPVIQAEGLTKYYGRHRGVIDIDLSVNAGEIVGFLGPNGAGKSTTIRILLDHIRPTRGVARVFGIETTADPVAIHRRVGYLPGEFGLYDGLTGGQTIEYFANLRGDVDAGYRRDLIERLDLDPSRRYGEYSPEAGRPRRRAGRRAWRRGNYHVAVDDRLRRPARRRDQPRHGAGRYQPDPGGLAAGRRDCIRPRPARRSWTGGGRCVDLPVRGVPGQRLRRPCARLRHPAPGLGLLLDQRTPSAGRPGGLAGGRLGRRARGGHLRRRRLGAGIAGLQALPVLGGGLVIGLYGAALAGVGILVGGALRPSWAGPAVAGIAIGMYILEVLGGILGLPEWAINLSLTAHLGQPIGGLYDVPGLIISSALAIGGLALGAIGFSRRDLT